MQTAVASPIALVSSADSSAKTTKKSHIHPLTSLFAGAVAGGVEATITYPFEYAKTSTQLRSQGGQSSTIQALRSVVATQGLSGIYTGCSALVVGTALKAGVRFLAFDTIKARLVNERGQLSTSAGILAGSIAGAVESVLAVTPTERIKTALIDDGKGAKRFQSTPHAVGILIREQGIAGLYRGLSATSAVRMGSYNSLKTQYASYVGHAPKTTPETFAIGACAGLITVYATQPFDTIKTRTQSSQGETLFKAVRGVWTDGGVRGFWKGSGPRLGRLLLSGGIVFSVYERILSFF
ncbi:hypothetical protein E4T38_08675 [Aureobasidium subglaciale]|nr:hypothetical protein E4T38_08675 [Aureobasidium subglaciale]KAI5214931.1 hypothetical protein E4T40_08688 [Aureobasidium subglaciale]KAI5218128.1 hypothetical protein E4T41_08542 [Aureobasidium subglaciale]KAI5255861.1 hypothetical protein E4T46_08607 [Aureobasidium subglaciale]